MEEFVDHLFIHCDKACAIWDSFLSSISFSFQ